MSGPGPAWRAPGAVGAVGLAATVTAAAAGGFTTTATLELLAYSLGGAAVAGVVAAAALRVRRPAGVTTQAVVAALAPVLALAVALTWAAASMFLMAHDTRVVVVALVAAGTAALVIAMVLGRRLVDASTHLVGMARRLDAPGGTEPGRPGPDTAGELVTLARELEATSARLAETRERADALEHSRRELVAWVSHDLRSPLAAIRALVEALEDGVVTDAETVARYHATIGTETQRLAGLVDDLFELSRIQAGALRLDTEWVPLDELVADAVGASAATASAVELVVRAVPPAPVVSMSAPEIARVIRNLVDNALRHTPAGGRVLVEAGGSAAGAWIAVSDSCGGIPADELDRVFETGFRGDAARTPGDGRGGLGLAVARGLVEAHRGRIEVANVGAGCRFTVVLPWSPSDAPPLGPRPADPAGPPAGFPVPHGGQLRP